MEMKILSRRGMGIRAIVRELGVSRNTLRKYLRGEELTLARRAGPGHRRKLALYEQWLQWRVEAAGSFGIPAMVLYRELRAMAYDGTGRTVRRFVAGLYPKPQPEPVVRYETTSRHQAQMDWGEYRIDRRRIYAFVGLLSYSRWLCLEYVDSMKAGVLIDCHRRMFRDFGAVPRRLDVTVTHRWRSGQPPVACDALQTPSR